MNQKAVTLSLVMAFIAIFFVQSYVSSIEESAKKKFGTEVMVLVASKNIKEMSTMDETMLEFKTVPKKFLEPAAISFVKKDDDETPEKEIKNLAGSVTLVPIKEGEQITFNKLTEPSIRTGLAPQITPGKRAISIPVTAITAVSKLVKPGDRVDVIVIFDMGGGKEKSMAKTILQDVAILSIGKNVTNNIGRLVEKDPFSGKARTKSLTAFEGFGTVSLEVDPREAELVALATTFGSSSVILSLRNNDDSDRVNSIGVMAKDLLGDSAFSKVQKRRPASRKKGKKR